MPNIRWIRTVKSMAAPESTLSSVNLHIFVVSLVTSDDEASAHIRMFEIMNHHVLNRRNGNALIDRTNSLEFR